MITKLHGSLPEDPEKNGLDTLGKEALAARRKTFLVVALVSGFVASDNFDEDKMTVWLRVRHAEVVPDDQRGLAAEILFQAYQGRTGALMLPVEPGEDFIPGGPEEGG